jgi:hypothetical protein
MRAQKWNSVVVYGFWTNENAYIPLAFPFGKPILLDFKASIRAYYRGAVTDGMNLEVSRQAKYVICNPTI